MSFIQRLAGAGALALALAIPAASHAAAAAPDDISRWNAVATAVAEHAQLDPLTESRIFAMVHLAVHDAVNAVVRRYQPFALTDAPRPGASIDAAAATAAHDVLVALMPAHKVRFDTALETSLAGLTRDAGYIAGIAVGRRAAAAMLASRAGDGSDRQVSYVPRDVPGDYRPTPPDNTPAALAHWGSITPFALSSAAQFRPAAPPVPGSAQARAEIAEIRRIGGMQSEARTEEQSMIAKYWYENSTQGWNRIAREIVKAGSLDVWERARLFALVNVAMADGFISGFEAKYHYRYWRPVTAIRESGDREWLSFLPTPPVPDHPSTHTVLGAAAARALARVLGSEMVAFSMESGQPYAGLRRQFWSLSEAARENGASRMLAGIHFRSAVEAGYRLGEQVGDWTVDTVLLPIPVVTESAQR